MIDGIVKLYTLDTEELADPEYFRECYDRLSVPRRARTDEYRFLKDKKLSVGAGLLLDRGLREYGLRESEVRIGKKKNGKPYLTDYPRVHFNLSHSETMVLAVFAGQEVGCDIEYVQKADLKLAKRFFCPEEYEYLAGMAGEEQDRAFYQIWTMKESFLKATGMGMELPLDSFGFYLSGGRIWVRQSCHTSEKYEIFPYHFGRYEAAVCMQRDL